MASVKSHRQTMAKGKQRTLETEVESILHRGVHSCELTLGQYSSVVGREERTTHLDPLWLIAAERVSTVKEERGKHRKTNESGCGKRRLRGRRDCGRRKTR